MKSSISKPVSLFVFIIVLACQFIGFAEVVDIPDPNLRKVLKEVLQINAGQDITTEALAELERLDASNRDITNLSGLEHCTGLIRLHLSQNQLTGLTGLANLTDLTNLNLNYNQISTISPLAKLTNLTSLGLFHNQISDVSPLTNLTNLTHLDLTGNQISDVNSLVNLTDLTNLNLNYNQISTISSLANLTNLTSLGLFHNQISDVSPLANLTNLIELTLWSNQVNDVSPLANLINLKVLSVSNNQLTDLGGLANLTNLTELNLNYNQLTNLNGLANANFPELKDLSLVDNQLSDLNGLVNVNLPKLTSLRLWSNLITDLDPLSNASLLNLVQLDLNDNQISDISPIVENEGISGEIKLKNNPLNNTSLTSHIPALKARGLKVEHDEAPANIIKISDSAFEVFLRQVLEDGVIPIHASGSKSRDFLPTEVISKINTKGIVDLNMANTGVVNIDVEALKALPELKAINLADNPLSREAVVIQIPDLETAGIKVNLGTSETNLVELSVDKFEIAASQAATKILTIAIKDVNDHLVKREVVTLAVDKGSIQEVADNQGDGTYQAVYTATDTVGEAKVTAVIENGVLGTIKLKLVETVVSAKKSTFTVSSETSPKIGQKVIDFYLLGESITVVVKLLNEEEIALSGKEIKLKVRLAEGIKIESEAVRTNKEGKAEFKFIANSKGVKTINIVSGEIELEQTRAVIVKERQPPLVTDVNGDSSVNIFDLVMVAGQFGKSGAGLSGDVNGDSSVNIFDLVMIAGNFGKSNVAVAPVVLANKLAFTTSQKWSIQSAIMELEGMLVRSEAEELVFNLLQAILPVRLPEQTQLLPNYPNPFNPETWIPFELSQDSEVSITIYDVVGTPVISISVGYLRIGRYVSQSRAIYWDGKTDAGEKVVSGTYFYTLKATDYVSTQKMVILK